MPCDNYNNHYKHFKHICTHKCWSKTVQHYSELINLKLIKKKIGLITRSIFKIVGSVAMKLNCACCSYEFLFKLKLKLCGFYKSIKSSVITLYQWFASAKS